MNWPEAQCHTCASLEIHLPSTRDAVNTACETVQEFLRPSGAHRYPSVQVVLRELLLNAVAHGNAHDAFRAVRCRVALLAKDYVQLQVEDEGDGFAHDQIRITGTAVDHPKDRHGYDLICALADRLEFNASGSRITAYLALRESDLV